MSKILRLPRKSEAKSCKVPHLSRRITLVTSRSDARKCNHSRSQRLELLTCLTHVSLVLRQQHEIHLCRYSSNAPRLPSFSKLLQTHSVGSLLFTFDKVQNPARLPHRKQTPKSGRNMWCFTILTSECAWRQNGGHFFNISTSKGDRRLRCFGMLTSTCASRHNGVQFLILHLPRWLYGTPAALVTPLCDPPGPQNIGKTHRFATFILFFLRTFIFFLLTLSLL